MTIEFLTGLNPYIITQVKKNIRKNGEKEMPREIHKEINMLKQ